MAYDMGVVATALSTATGMGASSKVLLSLFEAAIVESGFRNLDYGDRDSVGFLQQRPSQGWPNPMDVPTATRSFVAKAQAVEGRYTTSGKLAQAVQVSAYPDRYDKAEPAARELLTQAQGSAGGGQKPDGTTTSSVDLVGAVRSIADAGKTLATGVTSVGNLAEMITKIALPSNALRLVMGILGIVFILLGIHHMGAFARKG